MEGIDEPAETVFSAVEKKATVMETPKELCENVPPVERVVLPHDVSDIKDTDDIVYVIGTKEGKVTRISGLEHMTNLKTLILRSCLISSMEGVEELRGLEKLELYDNHIEHITHLQNLSLLRILDLSFNSIRHLIDLGKYTPLLEELYVAQNKLKTIEGLTGLKQLKVLDLGANRIRVIEGLEENTELKSLWLGKNKIEEITGLEKLTKLEQLDIQNNRLTSLGNGLLQLKNVRELYLACNEISHINFIEQLPEISNDTPPKISTIDLSSNKLDSVEGIERYISLEEVWLSGSALNSFEQLKPFSALPNLTCLYLEHSPIAKDFEYRKSLTALIPTLQQLDATLVVRSEKNSAGEKA